MFDESKAMCVQLRLSSFWKRPHVCQVEYFLFQFGIAVGKARLLGTAPDVGLRLFVSIVMSEEIRNGGHVCGYDKAMAYCSIVGLQSLLGMKNVWAEYREKVSKQTEGIFYRFYFFSDSSAFKGSSSAAGICQVQPFKNQRPDNANTRAKSKMPGCTYAFRPLM